jgi:hypothetical protein
MQQLALAFNCSDSLVSTPTQQHSNISTHERINIITSTQSSTQCHHINTATQYHSHQHINTATVMLAFSALAGEFLMCA